MVKFLAYNTEQNYVTIFDNLQTVLQFYLKEYSNADPPDILSEYVIYKITGEKLVIEDCTRNLEVVSTHTLRERVIEPKLKVSPKKK